MRAAHLVDGFDPVVEEEHLAAAFHLAADGIADDAFVVGADGGGDRHPVRRRGVDGGHVARAHQRHVERARDRRGGQSQHVHLAEELFELFLVGDAEALLLIDDDEAEVLELHVAGNQAVGADDEVHRAVGEAGDGVADFGGGAEAVEQVDADRIVRHAFAEGAPVLFGEHGGGHEDGDLFAAGDGLEGGADGDLGFAEADIAADQAVHRAWRFEVVFGFARWRGVGRRFRCSGTSARTPTSTWCPAGGRSPVRAGARPARAAVARRSRGSIFPRPCARFSTRCRRVC